MDVVLASAIQEQTAAIREQTELIREFVQLAKSQAEKAETMLQERSPEKVMEVLTGQFPDIGKMLEKAMGKQPTASQTLRPNSNGGGG